MPHTEGHGVFGLKGPATCQDKERKNTAVKL